MGGIEVDPDPSGDVWSGGESSSLVVDMFQKDEKENERSTLFQEGYAFEGAAVVALMAETKNQPDGDGGPGGEGEKVLRAMEIVLEDGVMLTVELDSGEKRLMELGYTQTLQRELTGFELYSSGFACIGLFVGILPYYGTAFSNGGPVAVVWFWWIPGVFSLFMTASLAEIASSLPLASSMYFWAAHLAPPKHRPLAAWITGWLEFIGVSIATGGTVLAGVGLVNGIASIAANSPESVMSPAAQFGAACAVLVLVGSLNFLRVKRVGQLLVAATVYQIFLAVAIMICVPVVAPTTQKASFVFSTYLYNWVGTTPTLGYSVVLAMLLPQYSQYPVDAAAHVCEEAKRADVLTPRAMVGSQVTMLTLAWGILVAITFSIQDVEALSGSGGNLAFVQVLLDVFVGRFGTVTGVCVILSLIYVGFFACSFAQILTAGRVAYALARDGGLPFSNVWTVVNSQKVPIRAVALTCAIGGVSLIPSIWSSTAYFAITSMSTVAWFCSYLAPLFFRLVDPDERFTPGPFYLPDYIGVFGGKLVHLVSLLYVLYTISVFLIPNAFPIQLDTFNWAPLGIVVVVAFFLGWWVLDARKWYNGPLIVIKGREQDNPNAEPTMEEIAISEKPV